MKASTITKRRFNIAIALILIFFADACVGKDYTDEATIELEKEVQSYATNVITYSSILQAVFPLIMCFFFGAWSDKYGRKPVLLGTTEGCTLSYLILLLVSTIKFASPWFSLLFILPHCLTGGIPAFLVTVLCLVRDVTEKEHRAMRMATVDGFLFIGTVLGQFSSSFLLDCCGYAVTLLICAGVAFLAWLYIFMLIPEFVQNIETKGKFHSLFKYSLLKATIQTTVKKREKYERPLLVIAILIFNISSFVLYGNGGVIFLYLRRKFQWTLTRFTLYSGTTNAIGMLGTFTGILFLHKLLHLTEATVMLIGRVSSLASVLLQGFATQNWHIYVAGGVKGLQGLISPMELCFLSKLVSAEDSGKIFSVLLSLNTIFVLIGLSSFMKIYSITLTEFPEAFNFVASGLCILVMVLITTVIIMERFRIAEKDNGNTGAIN